MSASGHFPVSVRRIKDESEIDEIRIIENLFRRAVTPYETAINIARLIEIHGNKNGANQHTNEGSGERGTLTLNELSKRFGLSEDKITKSKTISNLIPELGQLLNDKVLMAEFRQLAKSLHV